MKMGLLGEKLPYTRSPEIHSKILKGIGREGEYGVYEKTPEQLADFFDALRSGGFLGMNVTIPHKTRVMAYLDEIAPEAKRIGAVNTIHTQGGRLMGYNTDYFGFGYMLKKAGIEIKGREACVLGAGGAARAVAVYLQDHGASVTIISRDAAAVKGFEGCHIAGYDRVQGDLLVNTTPVGMSPNIDASPISKDHLQGFEAVADIVYNPKETLLLQYARELGIRRAGGLDMLVAQAVKAQEIWQGMEIPEALIDQIAEDL
jgi:shikimate dehydrogenase